MFSLNKTIAFFHSAPIVLFYISLVNLALYTATFPLIVKSLFVTTTETSRDKTLPLVGQMKLWV